MALAQVWRRFTFLDETSDASSGNCTAQTKQPIRAKRETVKTNQYLVFSFNRKDVRVHMDCAAEATSDAALRTIGNIRKTSDIIVALQPGQLRDLADKLENLSVEQIAEAQAAALREEVDHQSRKQSTPQVTSAGS